MAEDEVEKEQGEEFLTASVRLTSWKMKQENTTSGEDGA
jgi:hypothetical protein